jgi:serine protease AprX
MGPIALATSGVVLDLLTRYLRGEFTLVLNQLQKKDEPSEILVGFAPGLEPEEEQQLSLSSEASVDNKTQTLHEIQSRVNEAALNVLKNIQPAKSEANLPGMSQVEQDLSELTENRLDSSWLTNMVRMTATPSMIGKLARSKQVAFVMPNLEVRLPLPVEVTEADVKPTQAQQNRNKRSWGLERLRIPQLWEQNLTGEGVLIGHLDTGVEALHPDLEGKVSEFALFDPRGQIVRCDAFDSDSHGTHTAGTMVGGVASGIAIGVAPRAKLVSALVLLRGTGTFWQIIKGMEWAVSRRVRIINVSLGVTGYNASYEYALTRVVTTGVLPVCAVGNGGLAVTGSPGNLELACGVGAIGPDGKVPSFSGGGSISWYNSLGQLMEVHKPDLVAPGVGVYSSLPQGRWGEMNGTSMAAPHLAGVASLLIQAKPEAPLSKLIEAIYKTAKHPHTSNGKSDSRLGRGLLDPLAALEHLTS